MLLVLDGSVTLGPATSADGQFPGATINEPLFATPNPKPFNVATGIISRIVNSPSSFITLQGVGATDTVQKGDTLYFKCNAPVQLRLTMADPGGGSDIVSVLPVYGTVFHEFHPQGELKGLEVKGTATIVYLIAGNS